MPKRWFWHFYAFASLWNALLLWGLHTQNLPAALRPLSSSSSLKPSLPALVGLGLLELQAVRRLWESLCLFHYGDARMHLAGESRSQARPNPSMHGGGGSSPDWRICAAAGYLVGFAHYAMAALSLVADPACWQEEQKEQQPRVTIGLVAGTVLFVVASIEQVRRKGLAGIEARQAAMDPPPITPYPRPPTVPMPRRAGGPAQALLVLEQHQWWQATQRAAAGPGGRNDPRPAPRPLGLWPRGVPALHLRGAAVPGAGPPLPLAPFPSSSCWSRERHGGAAGAVGDGQPGRHGREDPAVVPAAVRTSGWWWWQWRWVG